MPLVNKIKTQTGILAIWETTETSEKLLETFDFSIKEKTDLNKFNVERRKVEFLTVRLLLKEILGYKTDIYYTETGKPYINKDKIEISISHCSGVVVVLASDSRVGIDVENTERNIDRIAKRFLHKKEFEHINNSKEVQKEKVLYWAAKEAIFKCTRHNAIQFNEQIFIHPFKLSNKGDSTGTLSYNSEIQNFKLSYFFYKNNVIVYSVEE